MKVCINRQRICWIMAACVMFACTASAVDDESRDLYVDAAATDDSGDGLSWAAAKQSLQAAIDLAVDGDRIWVERGTYTPIATSNKQIIIQSMHGATETMISGVERVRCATLGASITETNTHLIGFTLANAVIDDAPGAGVSGGRVTDSIIMNNQARGRSISGGGAAYSILNRCWVFSNQVSHVQGGGAAGSILYDCVVYANTAPAGGGGLSGCTVINSTVTTNSSTSQCAGVINCTNKNSIVWNNVLSDGTVNNYEGSDGGFGGNTFDSSCTSPQIIPNMAVDPLFMDPATQDYRLQTGSLAIGFGNNAFVYGDRDILGNKRIQGERVDLGAFEYPTDETTSFAPVPVPITWFDQYNLAADGAYEKAAHEDVDDDGFAAWEEFVALTNPTNVLDRFRIKIIWLAEKTEEEPADEEQPDDQPLPFELICEPYDPDLRDYEFHGTESLVDPAWEAYPSTNNPLFFKARVTLLKDESESTD